LSTRSCLYVIFVSLVSVFVSCTSIGCAPQVNDASYFLRQHLSLQPRATACLHLSQAAAAGEGSGSAAAAGLDVPSIMTVVGLAGLWLRLPPCNCSSRGGGGDGYIPPVSYSGSLLPLLHTLVPWTPSRLAILCYAFVLYGLYLLTFLYLILSL
jgi:hypothetical protein